MSHEHVAHHLASTLEATTIHDHSESKSGHEHAESGKEHGHSESKRGHEHAESGKEHGHSESDKEHGHSELKCGHKESEPSKTLKVLTKEYTNEEGTFKEYEVRDEEGNVIERIKTGVPPPLFVEPADFGLRPDNSLPPTDVDPEFSDPRPDNSLPPTDDVTANVGEPETD